MKRQVTIFFGPPGTGKTHTLLEQLERELSAGVPSDSIAFLTFTRRARAEATSRVEKALGLTRKELPFFRTIHSMAYRALKLTDGDVLGGKELNEFGKELGLQFGTVSVSEQAAEGITSQSKGDHFLAIDTMARLQGGSDAIKRVWQQTRSPFAWPEVEHFIQSYRRYKQEHAMMDFTDVLLEFVRAKIELPIEVAFVDEAQDLSALQWLAVLQACNHAARQYIAGDDDQALFRWAGAEVSLFQNLEGQRIILSQSFRIPSTVHTLAGTIISRVKQRIPKEFKPREATGRISRHPNPDALRIEPDDDWLWLVRNHYLLPPLKYRLESLAVVYSQHGQSSIVDSHRAVIISWERLRAGRSISALEVRDMYDKLRTRSQIKHGFKLLPRVADDAPLSMQDLQKEHGLLITHPQPWFDTFESIPLIKRMYYRALIRKHGSLRLNPNVILDTIHGAKGAEANKVALFLEQSKKTAQESQVNPDDEHRVFYVGVTRAREELHLIGGSTFYSYRI